DLAPDLGDKVRHGPGAGPVLLLVCLVCQELEDDDARLDLDKEGTVVGTAIVSGPAEMELKHPAVALEPLLEQRPDLQRTGVGENTPVVIGVVVTGPHGSRALRRVCRAENGAGRSLRCAPWSWPRRGSVSPGPVRGQLITGH